VPSPQAIAEEKTPGYLGHYAGGRKKGDMPFNEEKEGNPSENSKKKKKKTAGPEREKGKGGYQAGIKTSFSRRALERGRAGRVEGN